MLRKFSTKSCLIGLFSFLSMSAYAQSDQVPEVKQFFAAANAGTSFSPNGIGFGVGYEWHNYSAEIGLGLLSKKNEIGHPIYTQLTLDLSRWLIGVGFSWFQGEGERRVRYSTKLSSKEDVNWKFLYGHFSFGRVLITTSSGLKWFANVGAGKNLYSRVSVNEDSDVSNMGRPIGVVVSTNDPFVGETYSGPEDVGVYMQSGVRYGF